MREKKVAAAVVIDDLDRFLLLWNERWERFAFPMKDVESTEEVLPSTAVKALEDDIGRRLPKVRVKELCFVGKPGISGSSGEETLYDYWVYEVSLGENLGKTTKAARWLDFDALLADPQVSESTKEIVNAFVGNQEVAIGVIARLGATETEYLLIENRNYSGMFFPCTRVKQGPTPAAAARFLVRSDLGYHGDVEVEQRAEVPDFHYTERYGQRRAYRFHICHVSLAGLDVNQPFNVLERKLQARGLAWRWLTAEQLRYPPASASPTLSSVLGDVLQSIPPLKRESPIRRSEGSVALFRRTVNGQTEWLAQWNGNWKAFFFVGGHRLERESIRECVVREIKEELKLTDADFAAREPFTTCEYVAYSRSAQTDTLYTMHLFDMSLTGNQTRDTVDANNKNRWLTAKEILRQEAFDGRPVSVTVLVLLACAGLIQ